IYIPGGAYVIGSFSGNNISKTKIYGRGVISHSGKSRLASASSIPFSAVYVTGNGGGHKLEGIHICDMSHFAITYRVQADINNVKIMNFWHQSDGIISGNDSKILNCFFKVMDDGVKLYSQRMYVENATHFPQVNGAPYQFCWGKQNGDNCTVKNTYIVSCSFKNSLSATSNTAVINGRHGPGGNVETNNHTFDGIYIDNGCHRLIGFEGAGVYKNWVIKNVEINTQDRKPQQGRSYLLKGKYQNWKIINLTINGHKITGTKPGGDDPKNGKIWFEGNVGSLSFSHTTTVDNKAPSIPGIISFSNISKKSVKISWGASTDNVGVTGYDVFMNNSLKTAVTGTSATIAGLDCNTSYSFKVRAKDAAGNKSAFNNPKSVSTSDCDIIDIIAPTVPGSISFSNITKTSVKLSWGKSTDNVGVTGYDVFMNNSLKTTVTGTSATITGLNCETSYTFKVRAKDAAGNKSAFNNPKSASTSDCDIIDNIAPTVPGSVSFSNITKTSLKISWGASTDNVGVTGYNVYMNNNYNTTVNGTSATITGLDCNTSYSFKVRAFDAAGNQSAFNASKSASTSACSTGQPITVSLSPIHDAFLQGKKGYNINLIRVEPKKRTGYMMFDLSSIDGTITSAKLKLKCTSDAGSGNIKINLGKTNNWTEKNLTVKNKPAAGVQLATMNKAYKVGTVYTWNLNAASLNSGGKVSLVVTQVSGNDAAFGSKENAANKPVLEITYTSNRPKVATHEPMLSMDIYPNPSNGLFNVSLNNDNTALIKIINLAGEVVYQSEIQNGLNSIDASSLNQGIYLVHISTSTKAIIKRIIIQ
ncbi:MAG: fibronectin type III domain-containing protein, partial [Bacteroidales bacterium]|nr:fibronectin type III domain-containing protein [Bacteroidales bacterium]